MKKYILFILFTCYFSNFLIAQVNKSSKFLLINMDNQQANHLKAYGASYNSLKRNNQGKWLLNYKGGSFLFPYEKQMLAYLIEKGISFKVISLKEYEEIKSYLKLNNMREITLKKAPKIAIYTPPNVSPWADAVTLAMTYAEIPYDSIYDKEVLSGKLSKYDWLHLHHEDFTGQFSKFWVSYRHQEWFIKKKIFF